MSSAKNKRGDTDELSEEEPIPARNNKARRLGINQPGNNTTTDATSNWDSSGAEYSTGGMGISTAEKHRYAISHYEEFFKAQYSIAKPWRTMSADDISANNLNLFASYLVQKESILSHHTACGYMSAIRGQIYEHPEGGANAEVCTDDKLWRKINDKIKKEIAKKRKARAKKNGLRNIPSASLSDVHLIMRELLKTGGQKSLMDRLMIGVQYHILGSPNELGSLRFRHLGWSETGDKHTATITVLRTMTDLCEQVLSIFCSPMGERGLDYAGDFFHALGSYLAVHSGGVEKASLIFDMSSHDVAQDRSTNNDTEAAEEVEEEHGNDMSAAGEQTAAESSDLSLSPSSVASYLTAAIRKTVRGKEANFSSLSIRRGGATYLSGFPDVRHASIAARGGWEKDTGTVDSLMDVITGTAEDDRRVGVHLAGWKNLSGGVPPGFPMSSAAPPRFKEFTQVLFNKVFNALDEKLLHTCACSLVMNFSQASRDLGDGHVVIRAIRDCATEDELRDWEKTLIQHFKETNVMSLSHSLIRDDDKFSVSSTSLADHLQEIRSALQTATERQATYETRLSNMELKVDAMAENLRRLCKALHVDTMESDDAFVLPKRVITEERHAYYKTLKLKDAFVAYFTDALYNCDTSMAKDSRKTIYDIRRTVELMLHFCPHDPPIRIPPRPTETGAEAFSEWCRIIRNIADTAEPHFLKACAERAAGVEGGAAPTISKSVSARRKQFTSMTVDLSHIVDEMRMIKRF